MQNLLIRNRYRLKATLGRRHFLLFLKPQINSGKKACLIQKNPTFATVMLRRNVLK